MSYHFKYEKNSAILIRLLLVIHSTGKKNKDYMDKMKNLNCNQIKNFINLGIIGEEKLYIFFKSKNLKKIMQFGEIT